MGQLFARKPIEDLQPPRDDQASLVRVLGAGDLVMLAIGAVIGAGIFGAIGTFPLTATHARSPRRPPRLRPGDTVGLVEPIIVRPLLEEPGYYETIAGHYRRRAVALLGYPTIPALVRTFSAKEAAVAAVVTNDARMT